MAETKLTSEEINQISAQNLAYLGDCVYELYVREHLVRKNSSRASVESLKYVTAHIQSGVVEKILPLLTRGGGGRLPQRKKPRSLQHAEIQYGRGIPPRNGT